MEIQNQLKLLAEKVVKLKDQEWCFLSRDTTLVPSLFLSSH